MITLVCGAPGCGKSTYIRKHKLYGDVVIDLDEIYHALTGLPFYDKPAELFDFVHFVRNQALNRAAALQRSGKIRNVWVAAGLPKAHLRERETRRLNAHVVLIEASVNSCMANIHRDKRRKKNAEAWLPIVEKWWRFYEASADDEVIDYLDLVKKTSPKRARRNTKA